MAFNILESSVDRVGEAREKMPKQSVSEPQAWRTGESADEKTPSFSKNETDIQIIHLELLWNLTRVFAKLESGQIASQMTLISEKTRDSTQISKSNVKSSKSQGTSWTDDMARRYKKMPLTRALLLMHTTLVQDTKNENLGKNLQVKKHE